MVMAGSELGRYNPVKATFYNGMKQFQGAVDPYLQAVGGGARLAGKALPVIGNLAAGAMSATNRMNNGEDAFRAISGAGGETLGGIGATALGMKLASKAPGMLKIPAMAIAAIGGGIGGSMLGGAGVDAVNNMVRGSDGLSADRQFKDLQAQQNQAMQQGNMIQAEELRRQQQSLLEANGIKKPESNDPNSPEFMNRIRNFQRDDANFNFGLRERAADGDARRGALNDYLRNSASQTNTVLGMQFRY